MYVLAFYIKSFNKFLFVKKRFFPVVKLGMTLVYNLIRMEELINFFLKYFNNDADAFCHFYMQRLIKLIRFNFNEHRIHGYIHDIIF